MALQYCPNGECVNFQCEVETYETRCPMCAWDLVPIKRNSESATEDQRSGDSEAA